MKGLAVALAAVMLLAACASPTRAPVVDRGPGAQAQAQRPLPTAPLAPPIKPPDTPAARADSYVVRRGDTLYSIALDSGHDYREIAAWNNITDANVIREGQVLNLKPPSNDVQVRPIGPAEGVQVRPLGAPPRTITVPSQTPAQTAQAPAAQVPADLLVTEPKAQKLPYSDDNLALLSRPRTAPVVPDVRPPAAPESRSALADTKPAPDAKPAPSNPSKSDSTKADEPDAVEWSWPANGKILAPFSDPANKGVDIAGSRGDPVQASGAGRVVYIGEGLRGYGKLVIIKHNDTYLSAYAHNDAILVKEGQSVTRGQKIAEMGSTGTDQTKLHFEIRRLGKPVDPARFLPGR